MQDNWKLFLGLVLVSLIMEGFFSMMEMACVSFNRVRLQYYVSQKSRRAIWLSHLLNHPTRLFGTTLIGVNIALQFGSECARRFYTSMGLSPDLAPISQVIIVLILAELAPMFAARRYAEHVVMLGIPFIYVFSKIMTPVIWMLNSLCFILNKIFGISTATGLHITREELQKAIESRGERDIGMDQGAFDTVVSSIFSLKNKIAKELMIPLSQLTMVASNTKIAQLRDLLANKYLPYIPIFQSRREQVVGVAFPRDLLRLGADDFINEKARQPWFITESNTILQILKQFRHNNQSLAVVLNQEGLATGILSLDSIMIEIFGPKNQVNFLYDSSQSRDQVIIEKTFMGNEKIQYINAKLNINLRGEEDETLEELMIRHLGHRPNQGEVVQVDQYELMMAEVGVFKGKKITLKTIY